MEKSWWGSRTSREEFLARFRLWPQIAAYLGGACARLPGNRFYVATRRSRGPKCFLSNSHLILTIYIPWYSAHANRIRKWLWRRGAHGTERHVAKGTEIRWPEQRAAQAAADQPPAGSRARAAVRHATARTRCVTHPRPPRVQYFWRHTRVPIIRVSESYARVYF